VNDEGNVSLHSGFLTAEIVYWNAGNIMDVCVPQNGQGTPANPLVDHVKAIGLTFLLLATPFDRKPFRM
jgi:hypothetical protein